MRRLLAFVPLLAGCGFPFNLLIRDEDHPSPVDLPGGYVVIWSRMATDRAAADHMPPTQASRLYAYTALASYGAISGGLVQDGVLSAVDGLVLPEPPDDVDWPTAVAAATGTVGAALAATDESRAAWEALRAEQIEARGSEGARASAITRGQEHGEAVAQAILDWATGDGFEDTRDLPFEFPTVPGEWTPTPPDYAAALEPWWGTLRPFLVAPADCAAPPPVSYSEARGSEMWAEADAVLRASSDLTDEQREIAAYWADGDGTRTPAGHWLWIASSELVDDGADLETAARVHAVLALALADAIVGCWDEKYRSCRMRPVTYLQAHLDEDWMPLVPTPPSPEHTSVHAAASAVAAEVLAELMGDRPFVDTAREPLHASRPFLSLHDAAAEAAASAEYGGMHFPGGVAAGSEQGACVGRTALGKTR